MSTYHVVRVTENGNKARVTDRGMSANQAADRAGELRTARPVGSSHDFRVAPDGKL
jgi:hypothetical protein